MNVTVQQSSGDEDTWEDVAEVLKDEGSLVIVAELPSDLPVEQDGEIVPIGDVKEPWKLTGLKTLTITRQVPQEGTSPMDVSCSYLVLAEYAPGMWMKVEYVHGV